MASVMSVMEVSTVCVAVLLSAAVDWAFSVARVASRKAGLAGDLLEGVRARMGSRRSY